MTTRSCGARVRPPTSCSLKRRTRRKIREGADRYAARRAYAKWSRGSPARSARCVKVSDVLTRQSQDAQRPLAEAAAKSKRAAFDLATGRKGRDGRPGIGLNASLQGNSAGMRLLATLLALAAFIAIPALADNPGGISGTVVDAQNRSTYGACHALLLSQPVYRKSRRVS